MLFRQFRIAVTGAAGVGQLQRIDFRLGMGRLHNIVLAMAVTASRGISITVCTRLSMQALGVNLGGIRVTGGALDRLQFSGVGNLRNIAMTGHARQRRMYGLGKTLRIDGQGNFLPAAFFFQAGHGMTRQTDLVCRGHRAGTRNGKENHRGEDGQDHQRRVFFFESMNANRSAPPVAAIADDFACRDALISHVEIDERK